MAGFEPGTASAGQRPPPNQAASFRSSCFVEGQDQTDRPSAENKGEQAAGNRQVPGSCQLRQEEGRLAAVAAGLFGTAVAAA